ncbi:MAG: branched-chain amino acid aminotransferase [Chloroflexi bacterium]|nr:branched-chain amino acid aminotransferase [Chloroflexota bacterium]
MPTQEGFEQVIYIDGVFYPKEQAKISVLDHGLLHGDSVFDTCLAVHGVVFRWQAHVDRLFASAKAVDIRIPLTKETLGGVVRETVQRNRLSYAYIKIVVTRGVGDYPTLQPKGCKPSVIVFAQPYASSVAEGDVSPPQRVHIAGVRRTPSQCIDAQIKSGNYLNHVLAFLEAQRVGADNAIELTIDGEVCEAPGYNIFVVQQGQLLTPGKDILIGITRQAVFDLAKELGIPCQVARLTPFDLTNAAEVFLSSTSGGIIPVTEVDGKPVADGRPGPITGAIRRAYLELLDSGREGMAVQ